VRTDANLKEDNTLLEAQLKCLQVRLSFVGQNPPSNSNPSIQPRAFNQGSPQKINSDAEIFGPLWGDEDKATLIRHKNAEAQKQHRERKKQQEQQGQLLPAESEPIKPDS